MVGPPRVLRALVGVAAAAAGLTLVSQAPAAHAAPLLTDPATTHAVTTAASSKARPRADDDAPLKVSIYDLEPSYLPARGVIEVRGTVTNRDDEPWSNIRLYAFAQDDDNLVPTPPIRNAAALARAAAQPYDAVVGDRITDVPHPTIARLGSGETREFTLRVPADKIVEHRAGVYWFGVHALGYSAGTPNDNTADGRARTFLPYVPKRRAGSVPTALVLPLTREIEYADDGSLTGVTQWSRALGGGRVHDIVAFGQAAGSIPLTWLVDPALVDAVGRLARGNPARSIEPVDTTTSSPTASPTASPSASPTPTASPGAGGGSTGAGAVLDPATQDAADAASTWLTDLAAATAGDQVLGLPYGNLDVPAALQHDPALVDLATSQRSAVLATLGITTTPALAAPGGYLAAPTRAPPPPDTTVVVSDRMLPGPTQGVVSVGGHRVLLASTGAASGGPGPGPTVNAVALRQRILSEAAVRLLKKDPPPLVVVLPTEWGLGVAGAFFDGLEVPWLHLETAGQVASSATPAAVAPDALQYPVQQTRRELDAETFTGIDSLISAGNTLQALLTGKTDLGGDVTRQALSGASFSSRQGQSLGRFATSQAEAWIDSRLGSVGISAPKGVTLSGAAGKFAATLTNRLDQSVTVGVTAQHDPGIEIAPSRTVELGPHSHTTVILEAHASSNKVHNVTLMVTDRAGTPLGATDQLPIRSAQVSNVIWLIMGTGVGILVVAIGARLVRRFRRARRAGISFRAA